MSVPLKFRKSSEDVISSYDAIDILSGTGYATYYGGTVLDNSAATTYVLTSVAYDNSDSSVTTTTTSGSYTKIIDADFDVLLNKPLTIQGKFISEIVVGCNRVSGVGATAYAIVKLRKWDGTTETDLAEGKTGVVTGGVGTYVWQKFTVGNTVAKTSFSYGHYLRVTVEIWALATGGGANQTAAGFYVDPSDSTEIFKILIPVRIAL